MATVKDVTKEKQAKTVEDVNNQDARTRLWQTLNTTYSNQMEESDKAYDKAISQQNNAMLAKGMARSSYAGAISAMMYDDKINARNKLGENLIAEYQNRIGDIEAQEKEDEWRKIQFDENVRQYNENLAFQRSEAERSQSNWMKEYEAGRADTAWNQAFQQGQMDYQKQRDTVADQQWQKQYDEELRKFNENMKFQRERANVSDAQWQKTYDENLRQFNEQMAQQERQFKENLNFQSTENALNRAFTTSERIASQEYSRQERLASQEFQQIMQELQNAFTTGENEKSRQAQKDLQILQQAWQSGESALNREQQEALQRLQIEAQSAENAKDRTLQESLQRLSQAFTAEQNALNREQNQAQFEIQQAFAERQWAAQQEQWREEFDYNKMTSQQKIAFETMMTAAQKGNDVSDALLKQVGISRKDYNALKAQATGGGGGGGRSSTPATTPAPTTPTDESVKSVLDVPTKAPTQPVPTNTGNKADWATINQNPKDTTKKIVRVI